MSQKWPLLDNKIHEYIVSHSLREPDVLRELREETASHPLARMQITPEQGELMTILIQTIGARKALEVGVFTGYSATRVALAMPPDGRLIACDISEEYTSVARRYWSMAGVEHKIDLRIGPAFESLEKLVADDHAGTFDFAFIDADKTSYRHYYEYALQLVRSGGIIMLDNMLQSGTVVNPANTDPQTHAIREINDLIAHDDRVLACLLAIGDGVTIALKK
jgi:predicted O-methyltransferase YrrM